MFIMNKKHIHCDNCNTVTETKFASYPMKRYGQTYLMEGLAEVCPNCNGTYFDGKTVTDFENKIIQQIKDSQKIAA
jgi:uncharacterized protein with PIN domain